MRRLRYQVATSLDGYIVGPNGEFDWIIQDPDIDFSKLFATFDTAVMGRRTFETTRKQTGGAVPGLDVVAYSRTLRPTDYPDVTVIDSDPAKHVQSLKEKVGKDIWLFGGGALFRTFLQTGVVATVEAAVIPYCSGMGSLCCRHRT
jgi:dihydrofolate reductase